MSKNKGTLITSPIRPLSSSMSIPTAYANELLGGYQTVNTVGEMNNISIQRRVFGMMVYVTSVDQFYQLKQISSPNISDNLNWVLANFDTLKSDWVNTVISATGTPPLSPVIGDRYLVTSGSGVWFGYNDLIVQWNGSLWVPILPNDGTTVRVDSDPGPIYAYLNGSYPSGDWVRQNFVITGTPTEVAYFDVNGNVTSDSSFSRDFTNLQTIISMTGPNNIGGIVKSALVVSATSSSDVSLLHINTSTDSIISEVSVGSNYNTGMSYVKLLSRDLSSSTSSGILITENSVSLGPLSLTSSIPYFNFPQVDGNLGDALITDGMGNLTFGSPAFATPSQNYVDYVIATGSTVVVPDYQEYLLFGDLDVNGILDIGTHGKVVILNGTLTSGASSSIINMGNIQLVDLSQNISGPNNYLPKYTGSGLTSSVAYSDNSGNFVIGTPSFLSISNSGTISVGTISLATMSNSFVMLDSNNNLVYDQVYVNQYKTFLIGPQTITQSNTSPNSPFIGTTIINTTASSHIGGPWQVLSDTFHDTTNVLVDGPTGIFTVKPGIYNIFITANITSNSAVSTAPTWVQTHMRGVSGPFGSSYLFAISRGYVIYSAETESISQGINTGVYFPSTNTLKVEVFSPSTHQFDNRYANIDITFEKIG